MSIAPAHGTGPVGALNVTPTPTTGVAPLAVSLDASQSYPGRNQIASYTFDFGDGTTVPAGTATTASHTYTAAGSYTASVTVTDSTGMTTKTTRTVVVTVISTGLTSSDGTTTAPCATTSSTAPTMASLTPTISATVAPSQMAQFELRDLTDPSIAPPTVIGGSGSNGSTGPSSTVTTPTLVNGHEYAYAARSSDGAGNISPVSATCYFWAVTSGTQATPTGAVGLPFDNTLYPASSPQTWAGPLTTLKWANGTLSLYRNSDNALLWGAAAAGSSNVLALQNDGNIVIYSSQPTTSITGAVSGSSIWSTGTSNQNATSLLLAFDGSLSVRSGTTVLWNAAIATHVWKLNDGRGTTAADTGFTGGSPATLTTPGISWPSSAGYAALAGTTGYAATSASTLDTTKSFTVAAWVYLNNLNGYQTVVTQQGNTVGGFHLEYENNGANGNVWSFVRATSDATNTNYVRLNSPAGLPQAGTWTHLIGSWDANSGTMSIYVNGQLVGTTTDTTPIASNGPLVIGRGYAGGVSNNLVDGGIADVRVYQQTLRSDLASWLYQNTGFAKPAVPGIAGALISGVATSGSPSRQVCVDDLDGNTTNSTSVIGVYDCNHGWT